MVTMTQKDTNYRPKIALYEPDIPQNTAAIIRTCSCLGANLEIIEPCGFIFSDRRFQRVVMDYINMEKIKFYKRAKEFFDAVDSKNLGFNQDPVNFISSIEQAYNTKEFLEEFFTLLGEYTLGAHLKDFKIIDTLLLRFEEECLGSGMMDQVYFLKRMNDICPDAHILVEHIPRDKLEPSFNETIKYSNYAGIKWENY